MIEVIEKNSHEIEKADGSNLPRTPFQRLLKMLVIRKKNIQNLSALVFVNFVVAGVGFITQLKIANVLGKESFGLIAYGMAIATYGAVVIRFGLERTLVRDLIHFPDQYAALVKASLVLRLTLLVLFIAAILGWKLTMPAESDLSWGVILIVIANSAMSLDLQAVYDSWHKMTRHAIYNLLQRGLYFGVIWTILIVEPKILSIFSVGAATLLAVSMYLALQYSWAMKRLPADTAHTKSAFTRAINLAQGNIVVWLAALGGLSFGPLNQIMLKHYWGPADLGGYAAAWMMVTLVTILLMQVARVGNPSTARITASAATKDQKIRFLLKYVALMLAITIPVALPAIVAPQLILETFFRPEYGSAAPVLRIMGIYVFIVAADFVATQYVLSARMEKSHLFIVLFSGLASLLLCFILIPSRGAVGAAWALLISHGILISLYWARISFSLKI